jgi:glyoxylase-like metal-dependent hydrolase (beta-lactamase superfamily II)
MTPGKPDRPSLAAVVGAKTTLLLDAGASPAHIGLFLNALKTAGVRAPGYVALTHWHWDHVFGAATLNVPVIAHHETARQLIVLAGYDWGNVALDARVKTSEEIEQCAADIKAELPAPRQVQIAPADITFDQTLELHLGGITCQIQHVGGDHASDSCVMFIPEDHVLFLGDCLYDAIYTPIRHYTRRQLFPLLEKLRAYEADFYIEGHSDEVMNRAEFTALTDKFYRAADLIDQHGPDIVAIPQHTTLDEDTNYFVRALIAGESNGTGHH